MNINCLYKLLIPLALLLWGLTAAASQDSKHPILDKGDEKYQAPLDLNAVSLEKLLEYQRFYHEEWERLNEKIIEQDDPKLTKALLAYDNSRLKIVEVIPKLIKAYSIDDSLGKTLLTYADTFAKMREDYQQAGTVPWSDYRSYDFRLGISYQAMLHLLAEDEALYSKIKEDRHKKNTIIGAYSNELDVAYAKVEAVNAENPEYYLVRQLEKELKRIQNEIDQRQQKENR